MQLYDDYRTDKLKDKMAGRWFVGKRTSTKVYIETIGRSMALTMRVLLRKNIGIESFSFWMVVWGFLYIRLCIFFQTYVPDSDKNLDSFFSPFLFNDFGAFMLNVFSFLFLGIVIYHVVDTEILRKNSSKTDVLNRGESVPLHPLIDNENWFFRKEGFVQSLVASLIGCAFGYILTYFDSTYGIGIYFMGGSIALFIDESNYHRARVRFERIVNSKTHRAQKKAEKMRDHSEDFV